MISGLSSEERYRLIGKLIDEIKLRGYSYETGKAYVSVVKDFLRSGKSPKELNKDIKRLADLL